MRSGLVAQRSGQVPLAFETLDAQRTAALAEARDERERCVQALRVATVGEQHSAPLDGLDAKQLERQRTANLASKTQRSTECTRNVSREGASRELLFLYASTRIRA